MTFLSFIAIYVLFALAESIYDFSFASAAIDLQRDLWSLSITYAVGYGAEFLVSFAFAGYIDAYPKKFMLKVSMILIICSYILSFLFFKMGGISLKSILASAFLMDFSHHLFKSTFFTSIIFAFDKKDFTKVGGASAAISGLFRFSGPLLGAFSYQSVGVMWGLLISASVMSLSYYFSQFYRPNDDHVSQAKKGSSMPILATLNASKDLRASSKMFSLLIFDIFTTMMIAILTLSVMGILQIEKGITHTSMVGFIMGTGALGYFSCGMMMSRWPIKRMNLSIALAMILILLGLIGLIVMRDGKALAGVYFICSAGFCLYQRSINIVLQVSLPKDRFASFKGLFDMCHIVVGIIAILLSGFIFDVWGFSVFMALIIGIFMVSIGLLGRVIMHNSLHYEENS